MMKTVVETFIIEETQDLIYDQERLSEWSELAESLELKGQQKIAAPTKCPIPYMHMKNSLKNMFTVLCPEKVDISEYDITPIPLEILRLAKLSLNEKHFQRIQIWYDDTKPDPVCVGVTGVWTQSSYGDDMKEELKDKKFNSKKEAADAGVTNFYFSDENYYLIGRWADVKQSFKELHAIAKKRMIEDKGAKLKKKLVEAQRKLDDIELDVVRYLNGEWVYFDI